MEKYDVDGDLVVKALLGLVATLVGALVWFVKASSARADAAQVRSEQAQAERDKHLTQLIEGLTKAVGFFKTFEEEEQRVHGNIIRSQEKILLALERLTDRVELLATNTTKGGQT